METGLVAEDDLVETGETSHHLNRKNMPLLGVLVHGLCHLNLIWMEPQIWFHDHLNPRSFCPRRPRRCESRGFSFTTFRSWSIFWGVRKCWYDLWRIFFINPQSSYLSIHSLIAPTFLTPWSNKCIEWTLRFPTSSTSDSSSLGMGAIWDQQPDSLSLLVPHGRKRHQVLVFVDFASTNAITTGFYISNRSGRLFIFVFWTFFLRNTRALCNGACSTTSNNPSEISTISMLSLSFIAGSSVSSFS